MVVARLLERRARALTWSASPRGRSPSKRKASKSSASVRPSPPGDSYRLWSSHGRGAGPGPPGSVQRSSQSETSAWVANRPASRSASAWRITSSSEPELSCGRSMKLLLPLRSGPLRVGYLAQSDPLRMDTRDKREWIHFERLGNLEHLDQVNPSLSALKL